ncbi:MAG: hypothetical protein RL111_347 [Pseudomonadota bacterium]|jgi:MFS family permease
MKRSAVLLINVAHALDHMFLLIFATAVTRIAQDLGVGRWEDLMPYSVASFFLFGLGSIPAGRLGDLWGRRPMMLVFFAGMGVSALLVSVVQTPWQLAAALALLGLFAAIYHPVGIPMLLQSAVRPGLTIGINGMSGNLGIALAAVVTGFLVKHLGWRAAFALPGLVCLVLMVWFWKVVPPELQSPAKRQQAKSMPIQGSLAKLLLIMTLASTSGSLLFNFTTNSNYELLTERFAHITSDPALLGALLAAVYALASLMQLVVGHLLDRFPIKQMYLTLIGLQMLMFALAVHATGWWFYVLQFAFMAVIFGAIPFTDAMIVRYVDDAQRSRVSGMRLAVSLGASSLAVWLIGPVVKAAGFSSLLMTMTAITLVSFTVVSQLPSHAPAPSPSPAQP